MHIKFRARFIAVTVLVIALFCLCACNNVADKPSGGEPNETAMHEDTFTDGRHTRDNNYGATFNTKPITIDGLSIHFEVSAYDAGISIETAHRIAEDYTAVCGVGGATPELTDIRW